MTFPNFGGVLDDFNRSNRTPLGGNWSGKIRSADTDLSINGNVAHLNSGSTGSAVWGPAMRSDQEAFVTLTTADVSDTSEIWCRATALGGAAPNGYRILFTDNGVGADTLALYRVNGGAFTQLSTTFTGTIANGEKIGIDAIGSTISAYSTASGVWTQRVTATDTAWTTGQLAIVITANDSFDDFGGGTPWAMTPSFQAIPFVPIIQAA